MTDFREIEEKWQKRWEESRIFESKEDSGKKKYYILEMYPYPSGTGLHMGHARNYTIGDVFARFRRMQGYEVLYPMGYDSFGLPAENAAIKAKSHPKIFTEKAIESFVRQQKELGLSYDWTRRIASHSPEYYRWDQWIFLKLYEKGLAYKKKASVNWCCECQTVLANEQVHNGKCWRHPSTEVEIKELSQWFFRITDYASELLDGIDSLKGWEEDVKQMQRNWIGKSHGTLVNFHVKDNKKVIPVFTTRPDTLWGVTFIVFAPEHPMVSDLVKGTAKEAEISGFVNKVILQDRHMRAADDTEKEGLFTGKYAVNPVTGEDMPIYVGNFVLMDYGTGAIMSVPTHDQRDFEFAKKYGIPMKVVINPFEYDLDIERMPRAYEGDGRLVNSGEFSGDNNRDAIPRINEFLEKEGLGKATVQYKLRDWLVSRQRFWGCPIPIIYCEDCGIVPVPEKDLPVRLPDDITFSDEKGNPLAKAKHFVKAVCPSCGRQARRETDTMDTFVDSSWYFLRYTDPNNHQQPFDKQKAKRWMPVDLYIGGREHATMHLIYFRFFTKFLRDIGMLDIGEPACKLFNQGMLHKGGHVMSKSRGNVVSQEEISQKYGIDTARFFLMFIASPEKDIEWDDNAVEGCYRFIIKLESIVKDKKKSTEDDPVQLSKLNSTISSVTGHIEGIRYNQALIQIMSLANYLHSKEEVSQEAIDKLLLLIAPFTPHLAEELWESLGKSPFISTAGWPVPDESKIDVRLEAAEDLVSSVSADISRVLKLIKVRHPEKITIIVSPDWKYTLLSVVKNALKSTRDIGEIIRLCSSEVVFSGKQKHIARIVPHLVRDPSKIPGVILDENTELDSLKKNKDKISSIFNAEVEIITASKSNHPKADMSMPSKPAIVVS